MLASIKNIAGKSNASASVVDGKLILSFPHALTPVVWQMDITQAKSSALEVLKAEKDEIYTLTLKTQKGEKVEIASFDSREQAINGLMAASKALEAGHGNMQIAANEDQNITIARASQKKGSKGKWITGIVAAIALFLLFGLWGATAPSGPQSIRTAAGTNPQQSSAPSAAQSAGVPVSADDFLNGL